MLSARCREPRPSQFSPRLQVRVISTSNIYLYLLTRVIISVIIVPCVRQARKKTHITCHLCFRCSLVVCQSSKQIKHQHISP